MGSVVLSIDAELGWGHHDRIRPPERRISTARRSWIRLLHMLDEYDLPATWAVVGHLFLNNCDGQHVDHPAPADWFAREHGEWKCRPELRFGYGIIEATQAATADHEIACHSFSHVEFGSVDTSQALARAEIEASIRAARDYDIKFDSFIFPRNKVAYRDILADYGFTCYRGHSQERRSNSPLMRTAQKLVRATITAPPLVEPYIDEYGLVDVPASMYLFGLEDHLRTAAETVWGDPMFELAKRGIDRAAKNGGLFHLWFHPNDLIDPEDNDRVKRVLAYLASVRDATPLTVKTMRSVAADTLETANDGSISRRYSR